MISLEGVVAGVIISVGPNMYYWSIGAPTVSVDYCSFLSSRHVA